MFPLVVSLVAFLGHAQVVAGKETGPSRGSRYENANPIVSSVEIVGSLPLHRSNPHVADNIRTQTRKSRGNHCQDYKTYD